MLGMTSTKSFNGCLACLNTGVLTATNDHLGFNRQKYRETFAFKCFCPKGTNSPMGYPTFHRESMTLNGWKVDWRR